MDKLFCDWCNKEVTGFKFVNSWQFNFFKGNKIFFKLNILPSETSVLCKECFGGFLELIKKYKKERDKSGKREIIYKH